MKTPADRDRHDVALFRYGLIADIMTLPPGAERAAAVRARADRAQPRRMSPDVIETLLSIKRDAPKLSVRKVIEQARDSGEDGETHAAAADDRGRKRKTCLLAILDDATRVHPLCQVLICRQHAGLSPGAARGDHPPGSRRKALRRQRQQLPLSAAGDDLRPPRHRIAPCAPIPRRGKGKIDRFFRTVRQQALAPLDPQDNTDR